MAHHINHSAYARLTERLNRFPQGAPDSPLLEQILKILLDDREAELISLLPIRPFTASQAGRVWKMSDAEAAIILDRLAGRAVLVDIVQGDDT